MNTPGKFSADVLHNRNAGIGGSDARRIIDVAEWRGLYLEKIGEKEPEDLSDVFRVQLGRWTEPFHRDWFFKMTSFEQVEPEPYYLSDEHPFMFAHLDAYASDPISRRHGFVELKHSNSNNSLNRAVEYYLPQIAHQCVVLGLSGGWLSVILGNEEPSWAYVEPPADYIDWLIRLEKKFWSCVEARQFPDILPVADADAAKQAAVTVKINGMRAYDWSDRNEFVAIEHEWLANREAAKKFDAAAKALKGMVPADASEVIGKGLTITRNKANALTIKAKE